MHSEEDGRSGGEEARDDRRDGDRQDDGGREVDQEEDYQDAVDGELEVREQAPFWCFLGGSRRNFQSALRLAVDCLMERAAMIAKFQDTAIWRLLAFPELCVVVVEKWFPSTIEVQDPGRTV